MRWPWTVLLSRAILIGIFFLLRASLNFKEVNYRKLNAGVLVIAIDYKAWWHIARLNLIMASHVVLFEVSSDNTPCYKSILAVKTIFFCKDFTTLKNSNSTMAVLKYVMLHTNSTHVSESYHTETSTVSYQVFLKIDTRFVFKRDASKVSNIWYLVEFAAYNWFTKQQ